MIFVPMEKMSDPAIAPVTSDRPRPRRGETPADLLPIILKNHFGFDSFRAGQEIVCRTATEGQDVLIVMPTGAGKSLCYQIPAIARGGNCLVVSPLVALIEDQVVKLRANGLTAERIHSGRPREHSRQVCQRWLAGELDFLFIAPERLSVPGFPEFLAKRPPSLIAIDEAHCISQWGHDFRPDYRILGERLGELRPAPVIALTATATPAVQDDICRQLNLKNERRIIQGFRRKNIAIHVDEIAPGARGDAILKVLERENRLPAIVYAPTRKKADELASLLAQNFRVGSYHAGLSSEARERAHVDFLAGSLDVIIATVAFGMGIDKPNIRTVIHAALPGSIEGFYQEIGRAGRDGQPSEAYLLQSFADQKTHEFFFEKNYPRPEDLQSIYAVLKPTEITKDALQSTLSDLDPETFARALEQLWVHRGVVIDPSENMTRGKAGWKSTYLAQREQRQKQFKQMFQFTNSSRCRMVHLVGHFGDQNDSGIVCGICDVCSPERSGSFTTKRKLSDEEEEIAQRLLATVERNRGISAGKLFQTLADAQIEISRGNFEKFLAMLEKNALLISQSASFVKNGETIEYRKLSLPRPAVKYSSLEFSQLEIAIAPIPKKRLRKPRPTVIRPHAAGAKENHLPPDVEPTEHTSRFETLRKWRLGIARQKGIPAFRILSDRILDEICERSPQSNADLIEISGISHKTVENYGAGILGALMGLK